MIEKTEAVHRTYKRIADDYSASIAIINAFQSKFYIRTMPRARDSVLDIGCGTGDILARLSRHFKRSTGIDPIEKFVAIARQRAPGSHVHVGAAEELPFKDASFDYVISHVVFQHVDREQALGEAVRVLKPGGRLVIAEALSKDALTPSPFAEFLARMRFNLYLVRHYGLKRAKQAKMYRASAEWHGFTDIHRYRRFDFEGLQDFYRTHLPGARFQRLEYKIIAVIWDAPISKK